MATAFTATTTAVVGIGAAALRVGLDYNRMQQSSRAALTTLLGSAEAANAQMDKLDEFAKSSPFAKQVFIQAQQQLIGFGVAAEDVLPTLDAIQNSVAAFGGSSEDISSITDVLARLQSQGRLSGEALERLGYYGIDAAKIIGEKMGKTSAEIKKMASKPGGIPVEKIWDPLVTGLMDKFGGATDLVKQQMDGAIDRVKGAFRDIGSVLAAPFIDPKGGGRAVEWANALADAMRALEQKAKPAVDLLIQRFGPGLDRITPAIERVESAINGWDLSKVNTQLDSLTKYTPLIAGAATALFTLGGNSLGLSKLGISLNPVVAGMTALVATSPDLRDAFIDVLRSAVDLGDSFGRVLTPAATALVQASVPLMEMIADLVTWVSDLPQPVLAAGLAFAALRGPLGGIPGLLTPVGEAFRRIREEMALQRALAGPMTESYQTLTQQWRLADAGAQTAGRSIGAMGATMGIAGRAASTLGLALKTAFMSNPIGIALTAITAAVAAFSMEQAKAQQHVEDLTSSLDQQTAAWTENTREIVYNSLEASGAADKWRQAGGDVRDLVMAIEGAPDALERVNALFDENRVQVEMSAGAVAQAGGEYTTYKGNLADVAAVVGRERVATEESVNALREKNRVLGDALPATEAHAHALRMRNEELREAAEANMSAREAQIRATETEQAATEAIAAGTAVQRDNNGAVDANAAATIAADKALLRLAGDYGTAAEAMQRNNASATTLNATISTQRSRFIETATQMGYTRSEAIALANAYGLIPNKVTTYAEFTGADGAMNKISQLKTSINGIPRTVTITAQARTEGFAKIPGFAANGALYSGGVRQFADGGIDSAGNRVPRIPQILAGGRNVMWAEAETGWEAYISGKPSMRDRNLAILDEAARRLGVMTVPMNTTARADGGITRAPQSRQAPSAQHLTVSVHATSDDLARKIGRSVVTAQKDAVNAFGLGGFVG